MFTIQFFIYKTPGIDGDNNFPLFCFHTRAEAYDFVSRLVSVPRDYQNNTEYMVLNNPQHLPYNVRKPHMYDSDIVVDDPNHKDFGKTMILDGCYNIRDNWELIWSAIIDNNTNCEFGFREYLANPQQ
jgi:hypothetical protein